MFVSQDCVRLSKWLTYAYDKKDFPIMKFDKKSILDKFDAMHWRGEQVTSI